MVQLEFDFSFNEPRQLGVDCGYANAPDEVIYYWWNKYEPIEDEE